MSRASQQFAMFMFTHLFPAFFYHTTQWITSFLIEIRGIHSIMVLLCPLQIYITMAPNPSEIIEICRPPIISRALVSDGRPPSYLFEFVDFVCYGRHHDDLIDF